MEIENLCPDLEFAVARGIDLVQTMHPATSSTDNSAAVSRVNESTGFLSFPHDSRERQPTDLPRGIHGLSALGYDE